jgi:hypothetical protein
MKTTGYKLRHAIREAEHVKNLAASRWDDSLHAFEDELAFKATPSTLMAQYVECENRLAALQLAQTRYNLGVTVDVLGTKMTLCEAVKRVGGAGRAEKMWRSAAGGEKKDVYSRGRELTRSTDEVRAMRTISVDAALAEAKRAARFASALREAIEVGNSTELDIEGLDASLFE